MFFPRICKCISSGKWDSEYGTFPKLTILTTFQYSLKMVGLPSLQDVTVDWLAIRNSETP